MSLGKGWWEKKSKTEWQLSGVEYTLVNNQGTPVGDRDTFIQGRFQLFFPSYIGVLK